MTTKQTNIIGIIGSISIILICIFAEILLIPAIIDSNDNKLPTCPKQECLECAIWRQCPESIGCDDYDCQYNIFCEALGHCPRNYEELKETYVLLQNCQILLDANR